MAKKAEDALGELYVWDGTIEDVFDGDAVPSESDQDKAQKAFEEVIRIASVSGDSDTPDSVLSLAAQVLAKHLAKFASSQQKVVDILLKLCEATRAQSLRIHTIRSLLQIVKVPAPVIQQPIKVRIKERMQALSTSEDSNVILRHLNQLLKALNSINNTCTLQEKEPVGEAKEPVPTPQPQPQLQEQDKVKEAKKNAKESKDPQLQAKARKAEEAKESKKEEGQAERQELASRPQPQPQRGDSRKKTLDCPPASYLFLGNLPLRISNADLAHFLSKVDSNITTSCVQIKQSYRQNNSYAFVSLSSIFLAQKAMDYITSTRFHGRIMNVNYARGPPCETLLFVELTPQAKDLKPWKPFDFAQRANDTKNALWDDLCDELTAFGAFDVLSEGKIKFRDVENAKNVIKKHHFMVGGEMIMPVYDPDEQLLLDSARNKPRKSANTPNSARPSPSRNQNQKENQNGFALKSGRVVGNRSRSRSRSKEAERERRERPRSIGRERGREGGPAPPLSSSSVAGGSPRGRGRDRRGKGASRSRSRAGNGARSPLIRERSPLIRDLPISQHSDLSGKKQWSPLPLPRDHDRSHRHPQSQSQAQTQARPRSRDRLQDRPRPRPHSRSRSRSRKQNNGRGERQRQEGENRDHRQGGERGGYRDQRLQPPQHQRQKKQSFSPDLSRYGSREPEYRPEGVHGRGRRSSRSRSPPPPSRYNDKKYDDGNARYGGGGRRLSPSPPPPSRFPPPLSQRNEGRRGRSPLPEMRRYRSRSRSRSGSRGFPPAKRMGDGRERARGDQRDATDQLRRNPRSDNGGGEKSIAQIARDDQERRRDKHRDRSQGSGRAGEGGGGRGAQRSRSPPPVKPRNQHDGVAAPRSNAPPLPQGRRQYQQDEKRGRSPPPPPSRRMEAPPPFSSRNAGQGREHRGNGNGRAPRRESPPSSAPPLRRSVSPLKPSPVKEQYDQVRSRSPSPVTNKKRHREEEEDKKEVSGGGWSPAKKKQPSASLSRSPSVSPSPARSEADPHETKRRKQKQDEASGETTGKPREKDMEQKSSYDDLDEFMVDYDEED